MFSKSLVGSNFRFAMGQTAVYPKAMVTHVGMSCVTLAAVITSGSAAARWHPAFRLSRCCMEADVDTDANPSRLHMKSLTTQMMGAVSVRRSGTE
jgi:hypothetical protein